MSADAQDIDCNTESDDIFDKLQKLIESVEAEERELTMKREKNILARIDINKRESNSFADHINTSEIKMEKNILNSMDKKTLESNNFDDHLKKSEIKMEKNILNSMDKKTLELNYFGDHINKSEIKMEYNILNYMDKKKLESNNFSDHINKSELKNDNFGNELEYKLETMKTKNVDDEIIVDEDNLQLKSKYSQNNSEDEIEKLELSEMIICDEVSGNSDEDNSEINVKETIISYKDTHEKDNKRIKINSKKKENNKKKYDKKSESNSKYSSKKKESKRNHRKRERNHHHRKHFRSSQRKISKFIDDEKELKKKKKHELDTFWKIVHDDPSNLNGWTYLLNYVDGANNVQAAREAYENCLNRYPCCYGYWRKYADYERKNGTKNCENVFHRGLKTIPLSVDLWIHYLEYLKTAYSYNKYMIREQYERAIDVCGLEFRSDSLWKHYIRFELKCKQYSRVTNIYERLMVIPTYGYKQNFESFKHYIRKYPKNKILDPIKFSKLRKEVLYEKNKIYTKKNHDENKDSNSKVLTDLSKQKLFREEKLMTEKMISSQMIIYKTTKKMVISRLPHEKKIKRPFFHPTPLEESEIRNWKEYLEFEINQRNYKRIVVLFERCLIACAQYEEFWTKYVSYLESLESEDQEVIDRIEDVYIRACTVHHKYKPDINLLWALNLENKGQYDEAAQVLDILDSAVPYDILIIQRKINLERRRYCFDKVFELYEHYINTANSTLTSIHFTIKYAQFIWKILNDTDRASEILWTEIKKINDVQKSSRLLLELIEIKMSDKPINVYGIVELIDSILHMKSINVVQQVFFAQRKVEFLEEFGKDIFLINKATAELKSYMELLNDHEKRMIEGIHYML